MSDDEDSLESLMEYLSSCDLDLDPISTSEEDIALRPAKRYGKNKNIVCECGADKCKTTHVDWCPKYNL